MDAEEAEIPAATARGRERAKAEGGGSSPSEPRRPVRSSGRPMRAAWCGRDVAPADLYIHPGHSFK